MTTPTSTTTATAAAEATAFGAEDFTTGEGLRALLNRLFERSNDQNLWMVLGGVT